MFIAMGHLESEERALNYENKETTWHNDTKTKAKNIKTTRHIDTKRKAKNIKIAWLFHLFASKSSPRFPVCRRSIVGDETVEAKNTLNFISWWRKARIWKFMQPAPKLGVFQRLQSGPSNMQQACIASNQLQTDPKVISIN